MPVQNPFVPVAGIGLTRSNRTYAVDQSFSPTWTGTHTFQQTISAQSIVPRLTDTYDLGSPDLLWRKGYLSELDTLVFAEQTITLLGGWFYVSKDQGTFASDVLATANDIDFGKTMTPGDFVVMRSSLQVEYIQVGTLISGTRYSVVRDLDGTGANAWPAGTPFCVLGSTGNGRVELNAYDTPRLSVIVQGATYNAQTEVLRLGDLNGNWGYSSQTWGLAIGEFATGKVNLTEDQTNGLRIRTGTTTRIRLNPDGSGFLANSNISWDTGGNLTVAGNATIAGWTVNSSYLAKDTGADNTSSGMSPTDYPFYAGATYANRATAPFRVTPAGGLVATSATITGAITATSGSLSGLSVTGTLTLSGSGMLITAASPAARIQLTTTELAGYSDATTKQFYLTAADGKAYAGGGNAILGSDGLTLLAGTTTPENVEVSKKVKWLWNGLSSAEVFASTYNAADVYANQLRLVGKYLVSGSQPYLGCVRLMAEYDSTPHSIGIIIDPQWQLSYKAIILDAGDGRVNVSSNAYLSYSLNVSGGLNVGTASGAGTGEIKASGNATISGGLNVGSATGAGMGQVKASGNIYAPLIELGDGFYNLTATSIHGTAGIQLRAYGAFSFQCYVSNTWTERAWLASDGTLYLTAVSANKVSADAHNAIWDIDLNRPVHEFDANDWMQYDRANNRFEFYINGARSGYIDGYGWHYP